MEQLIVVIISLDDLQERGDAKRERYGTEKAGINEKAEPTFLNSLVAETIDTFEGSFRIFLDPVKFQSLLPLLCQPNYPSWDP